MLEVLGERQVQVVRCVQVCARVVSKFARELYFHPPRSEKQHYCSDECFAETGDSTVSAAPGVQHRPQVTVQCEEDGTL